MFDTFWYQVMHHSSSAVDILPTSPNHIRVSGFGQLLEALLVTRHIWHLQTVTTMINFRARGPRGWRWSDSQTSGLAVVASKVNMPCLKRNPKNTNIDVQNVSKCTKCINKLDLGRFVDSFWFRSDTTWSGTCPTQVWHVHVSTKMQKQTPLQSLPRRLLAKWLLPLGVAFGISWYHLGIWG